MTAATLPRHRHRKPSRLHRLRARLHRPQWPSWLLNWAWHRQATPHRPGLLRRCHLAALWLLAVLGDWWLSWRTWREGRRRAEDIEIARHGAQMARVEDHEPGPAVAAACAVTALIEAATDAAGVPPVRVGEPGPVATGPLPAAMADVDGDRPWEYPTGQFTALIDQMQLPARRADTF